MREFVYQAIDNIIQTVKAAQAANGSFRFCYESGIMPDAYMIILLRTLMIHDEDLIRMLAKRILQWQDQSGTWKLFHDEEPANHSATLDAYYALLASGFIQNTSEEMQAARQFILKQDSIENSNMMSKVILALTGQISWPAYLRFPLEFLLLPDFVPLNFYEFVGFARAHMLPVMITSSRKFTIQSKRLPNLSELQAGIQRNPKTEFAARSLTKFMQEAINNVQDFPKLIQGIPQKLQNRAVEQAKEFILKRIERNGTFYGYASSTFLMVYAWLALGYTREHSVIQYAIKGLQSLIFQEKNFIHLQNATSTVWDTALLSYALQEAGMSVKERIVERTNRYILSRQQISGGDWQYHNPDTPPGGWGFSDINTFYPDVDDTAAALRAIRQISSQKSSGESAWKKGYEWVISMQNDDGGWSAFEKNTNNPILGAIQVDGSANILTDPSTVDLTGRMLEFLGSNGHSHKEPFIEKAVNWLLHQQESNGSWYGRWGICYLYGTWAAVTGLKAVGIPSEHPAIQRAVRWVLSIQNTDGGWGESCKSDQQKRYVALGHSIPSQTAWAIDLLVSVFDKPTASLENGVKCLAELSALPQTNWRAQYPTGAGLPGSFYTNYHSYRYIWPLLAFAHYKQKFL